MLQVLGNRTYRHLFLAQVIELVGTGLATVALGLLAYDLAGPDAGAVLGTALAIKMVAYVGVAPIAATFAERLGAAFGLPITFVALGLLAAAAVSAAAVLWPAADPDELDHMHDTLEASHPHLSDAAAADGGYRHRHAFVIDRHHTRWPASPRDRGAGA